MSSSVLLQVGQCGNQIGDEFWHGVFDDTLPSQIFAGRGAFSQSSLLHNVWRHSDGYYRSINVDTELKVLSRLSLAGPTKRNSHSNSNCLVRERKSSNLLDDDLKQDQQLESHKEVHSKYTASLRHLSLDASCLREGQKDLCGRTKFSTTSKIVDLHGKAKSTAANKKVDTGKKFENHRDWYSRDNCITSRKGRGSNWALGYHGDEMGYDVGRGSAMWQGGVGVVERTVEALRKEVERCDTFQGVIMLHSLAGGTGAGLGSCLTEQIREDYPNSFILSCPTLPFTTGETPLQHYNSLLCLSRLHQCSDAVLLLDNDAALSKLQRRQRVAGKSHNTVSLSEMNRYQASCLLGAFLPLQPDPTLSSIASSVSLSRPMTRYSGIGSEPWDLIRVLCPAPNLKYLAADSVEGFHHNGSTKGFCSSGNALSSRAGFHSGSGSASNTGGFSSGVDSSAEVSLVWKKLVSSLTSEHYDTRISQRIPDDSLQNSISESKSHYLATLGILRGVKTADESVFGPLKKLEKQIVERSVSWNPYPCEFWMSYESDSSRNKEGQGRKNCNSFSSKTDSDVKQTGRSSGNIKIENGIRQGGVNSGNNNMDSGVRQVGVNCNKVKIDNGDRKVSVNSMNRCRSSVNNNPHNSCTVNDCATSQSIESINAIIDPSNQYSGEDATLSSCNSKTADSCPSRSKIENYYCGTNSIEINYSNLKGSIGNYSSILSAYQPTGSIKSKSITVDNSSRRDSARVSSSWLTLVSNSSSVVGKLEDIVNKARVKFTAGAFLHWYERYGCTKDDFEEAFECVDGIIYEYKHAMRQ